MATFSETVTDLSADLSANPITDDIILKKNEEAIKQHVNLLLLQDQFACIGRPYICAGLKKFINEPATDGLIAEIKNRIREAMRHETRIKINDLSVTFDAVVTKYVTIKMTLQYVNSDKTFVYESRLRRIL
ncbi:baseplate assembly protein W [Rhizobium phage RHph_I46]|uniref:Baseplate assembly protein W n=1 Tax=Rhizobium phage RHph_I1_9 TaxID=2509729 RepID=A0A7S5UZK5_9CAUD|nr:baseplate wedge subunit [Rhizobium phage RHph_I1_9]QIG69626.1 baseplate assembly protein W [Rhizobium phage RHph_I46]QIG70907.1 baseplate assembly protein W [Rhizobium phage RHph_I9]QIG73493.1 baseplate assembly protein W [Rhizobium phage RHph_I1_9]QIG76246.1 baseplate assembly protein W [Rhizobium phage RHph_I34]